ncbi:MAG: hypothetical protein QM753_02065 [Thermomicrobiales bacterium]
MCSPTKAGAGTKRETDAEKLAQLFITLNDPVMNDVAIISLVRVSQNEGASRKLNAENIAPAAFSYDTWNAANWRTVSCRAAARHRPDGPSIAQTASPLGGDAVRVDASTGTMA